jgi:membrane-associated progesterone receptor component
MFYGPGGPYASFAGRDASRALANMSFEPDDLSGDISGLGPFEVEALQEWEYKFKSKYIPVGTIKKNILVEGDTARSTMTAVMTVDRDIDASTIQGHMPEPTKQGSVVEKTREILDEDVTASRNEGVEKTKEFMDLDEPNTINNADVVEMLEQKPNVAERNNSKTDDAVEPEVVHENDISKPEHTEGEAKGSIRCSRYE